MIRYYKTLRGLRKAYGIQVRVCDFFDQERRIYKNGKNVRLQPIKELQEKVARSFAEQVYTWKVQKKTLSQVLRAVAVCLIGLCSNAFTWSKGKTEYTSAIPFLERLTTIASENSCEVANFLSGFAARLEQIINIKMYYYE